MVNHWILAYLYVFRQTYLRDSRGEPKDMVSWWFAKDVASKAAKPASDKRWWTASEPTVTNLDKKSIEGRYIAQGLPQCKTPNNPNKKIKCVTQPP
jgi:hypothetical protein